MLETQGINPTNQYETTAPKNKAGKFIQQAKVKATELKDKFENSSPETKGKLLPKIPAIKDKIIAPHNPAEAPKPEATPKARACGNAIIVAIIAPNISPFNSADFSLIFATLLSCIQ